jgi:hypothetical protein
MGKQPAFQFYPGDWTRDLDDQDLEVEGAWIRICCRLWWSETRGEMTKPLKEWARILRKTERKTKEILKILIEKRIASGSLLDNQSVNLISRRMKRDAEISQIRYRVGLLGGNPALKKQEIILDNQTSNQSVRSSSSSSTTKKTYTSDFLKFYSAYPNKKAKRAAYKAWCGLNGVRPNIDELISIIELQKRSPDWVKEGGRFIPHPATWLRAGRWEDEIKPARTSPFN